MAKKTGGCAFGDVTRNMVENISKDYDHFKLDIKKEFDELRNTNTNLYNHLSSRVQPWVTVVLTFAGSLITGLIVWGLSK
jgi:hypothetical protein